jgi:hypothetical protein
MAAPTALLRERIARHGLATRPCADPLTATALTTAVQAQDTPASKLGLRSRATGLTEAAVTAAIETDRTIVRTWLLRGTIHLVSSADLRWLVRLVGPGVARAARSRWRQLGLTDDVLDAVTEALPAILADGPRTRREIRVALEERGVALDPDPQAHTHAVMHASVAGLICRGPDHGRDSTFVLVDDWLPQAPAGPSGDDAVAELARRYFAAYSPATVADFAAWSGLPGRRCVDLIRDELTPTDVDGQPGYRLGQVEPARGLRLLPAYDNYLVGYRDRAAIVPAEHYGSVYQGGLIKPTVLVDGRVAGTWSLPRAAGRLTVTLFAPLARAARAALDAEIADVARFVGQDLAVTVR